MASALFMNFPTKGIKNIDIEESLGPVIMNELKNDSYMWDKHVSDLLEELPDCPELPSMTTELKDKLADRYVALKEAFDLSGGAWLLMPMLVNGYVDEVEVRGDSEVIVVCQLST